MKKVALISVLSLALVASAIVIAQTTADPYTILRQDLVDTENPHLQVKAMKELSMAQDPAALTDIWTNLGSPFLDIRLNALRALGRYQDPANMPLFETIILQTDRDYTIQERVVAIRSYMSIPGFDFSVLQLALESAQTPIETELIKNAISGDSFGHIGSLK